MDIQAASSSPTVGPTPKLRVTHLTLFSHGVASLKLSATVTDNAELTLSFPPEKINDVLKSLTAVDNSENGTIASISYNSPEVTSGSTMASLDENSRAFHSILTEACGTAVTLAFKVGRKESGTLVGLQSDVTVEANGQRSQNFKVTMIKNEDDFKVSTYALQDIADVIFDEESFQSKLKNTLRSKVVAKDDINKQISIYAAGSGERDIEVCYAIESPVYKFTYRFIFSDSAEPEECGDGEERDGQQLLIQAWAIVDNPSEEDLQDVQLSIISGMPISFRHDLYSARFVDRPNEVVNSKRAAYNAPSIANVFKRQKMISSYPPPPLMQQRAAQMQEHPTGQDHHSDLVEGKYEGEGRDDIRDDRLAFRARVKRKSSARRRLPGTFGGGEEPSETEQVENLFEYHIKQKVRIGGKQSALVPVVQKTVPCGRVSIYSEKVTRKHTLAAVKLVNDTDAPFESGPASVYEGDGRLIGEAMVDTCAPQAEALLPFSVELDCPASHECSPQPLNTTSLTIANGLLSLTKNIFDRDIYTFKNTKKTDMKLYVWHDIKVNFKIQKAGVSFKKMDESEEQEQAEQGEEGSEISPETTEEHRARFYVDLKSGQCCHLNVLSMKTWVDTTNVRTICDDNTIVQYESQGLIDAKMKAKLKDVSDFLENISKKRNVVSNLQIQRTHIEKSQDRIRQNISSLSTVQGSAAVDDNKLLLRYVQSLDSSEDSIEKLEGLIQKLSVEIDAEQENINEMIRKLSSE